MFRNVTWEEIITNNPPRIHPLDLVFFSGEGAPSTGIRKISGKTAGSDVVSHIGIVVTSEVLPFLPHLKAGEYYVLESTFSHRIRLFGKNIVDEPPDALTGRGKFGVQIRNLKMLIPKYKGDIYLGILRNNPWVWYNDISREQVLEQRGQVLDALTKVYSKYYGQMYNFNPLHLAGVFSEDSRPARDVIQRGLLWGRRVFQLEGKVSPQICSELVANVLIRIGLLPPETDARNILPVEFLDSDRADFQKLICPTCLRISRN